MAGLEDMNRIKEKVQRLADKLSSKFRKNDSSELPETQQEAADVIASTPLWRKKSAQLIGGAIIILATAGIIGTQQYIKNNTFEIYHLYANGVQIGTVDSKEIVEQWIANESAELKEANPGINMVLDLGELTYESESDFKLYADTEATLAKLDEAAKRYAEGVAVVVDGVTLGIVKDEATATEILTRLQTQYAPSLTASVNDQNVEAMSFIKTSSNGATAAEEETTEQTNEPGTVVTGVAFEEEVGVETIETEPTAIMAADELYKKIVEGSEGPTTYIVQEGDCVGCIAHKFDISPQVIYENNPWIVDDRITVGDELDLTVIQPEINVITTETVIENEEIAIPVEYVQNDEMKKGETKVIQQGSAGQQRLTYTVQKKNGYVVTEELVNKEVLVEPVPKIVEKGTLVVKGIGTGSFAYPLSNYKISSKYGKRWGRSHNGIDFTGSKTIKASDSGEVTFVGTKNGYGKTIVIDHKNGFETMYSHLSSYSVSVGDKVEKGDSIGVMGNTGRSTGVHLHFEIHKNGSAVNPLSYL